MRKILLTCVLLLSFYSYADDYKYLTSNSLGEKVYLNTNQSYIDYRYKTTYSYPEMVANPTGKKIYSVWLKLISKKQSYKMNLDIDPIAHEICIISVTSSIPKNNISNDCDRVRQINYDSETIYAIVGDYLDKNYKN